MRKPAVYRAAAISFGIVCCSRIKPPEVGVYRVPVLHATCSTVAGSRFQVSANYTGQYFPRVTVLLRVVLASLHLTDADRRASCDG